jgi:hypothetical protein
MRGFSRRWRPLNRPRPAALRPARAVGSALAGVILAAALTLAAPDAARGQGGASIGPGETATLDGVSVVNASGQPANVALTNGVLDVALPIGIAVQVEGAECMTVVPAPNFARCRVTPGARVTLAVAGGQAAPPAEAPAPPPAPPQAQPPFPQPPMALARAGAGGLAEDEPALPWAIAAAAGFGAFLLSSAILVRRRRRP